MHVFVLLHVVRHKRGANQGAKPHYLRSSPQDTRTSSFYNFNFHLKNSYSYELQKRGLFLTIFSAKRAFFDYSLNMDSVQIVQHSCLYRSHLMQNSHWKKLFFKLKCKNVTRDFRVETPCLEYVSISCFQGSLKTEKSPKIQTVRKNLF